MMNEWCGISQRDYELAFDRRNLEDGPLVPRAGDRMVLLGDEVRRAFEVERIFIHPQVRRGVEFRCVPHPSGRCLYYNNSLNRNLVGMMLEDLIR